MAAEWTERADYAPSSQQAQPLLANIATAGRDFYLKLNETPDRSARNLTEFCAPTTPMALSLVLNSPRS